MEEAILASGEPLAPATSSPTKKNATAFEFKGDGTEYFKIWIVNILLTVVTLGIYSAWATVRNNRYFYSNLYLDGHNFSYLAQPLTILKGRIIAVIAFAAFTFISQASPVLSIVLSLAFLIAMPYIVIQSLAFSRRMTAYRNVQFRFNANYGEAAMAFIIWPILGLISFGILYPMAILRMSQFTMKNTAYGTSHFDFKATYSDYGVIFLTMIGVGLVLGLPIWGIGFMFPALTPVLPAMSAVVYLGLGLFFMVQTNNLFFNKLSLEDHEFEGSLNMVSLGKVILINLFLTIITLGLYLPAAKVRMVKYIASKVTMNVSGSLDNFQAAEEQQINALGEEMGNVFDLGV